MWSHHFEGKLVARDIYKLYFKQHKTEIDSGAVAALAQIGYGPDSDDDAPAKRFSFVLPPRPEYFVPDYIRDKLDPHRYLELLGDEEARPSEFRLFREEYYKRAIRDKTHTSILVYDISNPDFGPLFAALEKASGESEGYPGCTLHGTMDELTSYYGERGRVIEVD